MSASQDWRCVRVLCRVWLFVAPWTVAHQAPLSEGFSRQEYWSGLPFSSAGDAPDPGMLRTRGCSGPRDGTRVSCIDRWVLYHQTIREDCAGRRRAVLVCQGCYNKVPETDQLKNQKFIALQLWRLKSKSRFLAELLPSGCCEGEPVSSP